MCTVRGEKEHIAMRVKIFVLAGLATILWPLNAAWAAKTSASLKNFQKAAEQNPQVIDQWVDYPNQYRQDMLTAAQYPEVLGELGRKQAESKAKFQALIRPLSQSEQRQVYELTRYPDLLKALAGPEKLSKKEIKNLTKRYSESVQEAAKDMGRKQHALLQRVNALNLASKAEFESTLSGIPAPAQQSFRNLLQIPELLGSMEENLALTQTMGVAYREDPVGLQNQLATYEAQAQARDNDAVAAFEEDLKDNPKVAEEMSQVAKEYADVEGYELYEVEDPPSKTQVYVSINPYPYWFGGPYWYPYAYWRPYPYWWGLGFYFGPGWGIGFWGYPSYYYTNWYYGYYGHFYRYPYLSNYYWRHYNRYRYRYGYRGNYWRGYRNGFYRGVDRWYRRSGRDYFSNRYINDGRNVQRFRDYGRREAQYYRDRKQLGSNQVSRSSYFPRARANQEASRLTNTNRSRGGGEVGRTRSNRDASVQTRQLRENRSGRGGSVRSGNTSRGSRSSSQIRTRSRSSSGSSSSVRSSGRRLQAPSSGRSQSYRSGGGFSGAPRSSGSFRGSGRSSGSRSSGSFRGGGGSSGSFRGSGGFRSGGSRGFGGGGRSFGGGGRRGR